MATYYAKNGLSGASIENAPSVTHQPRLVTKAFNYVFASNLGTSDTVVLAKIPKFATVVGFVLECPVDCGTVNTSIGTTSNTTRFAANFALGAAANMRVSSFTGFDNSTANCAVVGGSLPWQNLNASANGITVEENFVLTPGNTWAATVDGSAYVKGFIIYNVDEPYAEVD